MAHFVVNYGQNSLLQNGVHTTRVFDLSPTCNVTFRPHWRVIVGQADGGDVFVELNGLLKFEHGHIIVQVSCVPSRVDDDSLHLVIYRICLMFADVVSTNTDLELAWVMDILEDTMGCGNDGFCRDDGTASVPAITRCIWTAGFPHVAGRGGGAPLGRTVTGGCGPGPPQLLHVLGHILRMLAFIRQSI